MSNKANDTLLEQLYEDGEELGIKIGLTSEALHNHAVSYAQSWFEKGWASFGDDDE